MIVSRKLVHVAQAAVARPGELLVTLGLGSCVAILLYDPAAQVAGLAHVLLPEARRDAPESPPAKFVTTAVPHLVDAMEEVGAERSRLVARLVGGASMFGTLLAQSVLHTGIRNVTAARIALATVGIPIVGEEVGKEHGRSVSFDPADGSARVTSYRHPEVVL